MAGMGASPDGLEAIQLDVGENEASDLLEVGAPELLDVRDWDWAVWTVIDDVAVEDGLAVCGHRRGAPPGDGWETVHVSAKAPSAEGKTDDAEACARYDGRVYVFGSHFGSKDGPLERERQFVARFDELQLGRVARGGKVVLDVARDKFQLHRLVNDAFAEFGPELGDMDDEAHAQIVEAAHRKAVKKDKRWAGRIRTGDVPLNIEGAAFRDDGSLLLGLRYPVTADGHPILVELEAIDGLFDEDADRPRVAGFHVLEDIGSPDAPAGVRALRFVEGRLHGITGSLDSQDKGSILIANHPEAAAQECAHVVCDPPAPDGSRETHTIAAERLREFEQLRRIEGIARDPDGRFWYVSDDEDAVVLRYFDD